MAARKDEQQGMVPQGCKIRNHAAGQGDRDVHLSTKEKLHKQKMETNMVERMKRNKRICAMYEEHRDTWAGSYKDLYAFIGFKVGCGLTTVRRVLQANWLIRDDE